MPILAAKRFAMEEPAQLPISLKIVAVLFILSGISCVVEIVVALMYNRIDINFGVLSLFIGGGLMRLSRGWRTCALFFLWIGLILTPTIAAMFILASRPLDFTVFGQQVGTIPKELGAGLAAIGFFLVLWQYRVLTRPDIRRLFGITPD
jgi:hypothetical protein